MHINCVCIKFKLIDELVGRTFKENNFRFAIEIVILIIKTVYLFQCL